MKKLLVLGFALIFLFNCKKDDAPINCDEVGCTEIFVTLWVTTKAPSGIPVILDSFDVFDKSPSGELNKLDVGGAYFNVDTWLYPLYNDGFVLETRDINRTLVFKGYINEEEVASAEYVVTADCCHISLVSGNTDIIIE